MGKHKPHTTVHIDQFIGMRIRGRRTLLGMTQRELARLLAVEPPMLSKYELGENSVTVSRLYEIARLLNTSPDYFFEGFEDHHSTGLPAKQRLLLNLVQNFGRIDSKAHLEALAHVVRALAGNE